MDSIVGTSLAFLISLSPGNFPAATEEIIQETVPDNRIHQAVSLAFHIDDWSEKLGIDIIEISKTWTQERKKSIRPFLGEDNIELNIWLFEIKTSDLDWQKKIFEEYFPHVKINMQTFSEEIPYYHELQEAVFLETPPDIIMMKDGWVSYFRNSLYSAPDSLFSFSECSDFYFSFTCTGFQETEEKMLGVPLFAETFVMLYNEDLFLDDRIAVGDKPEITWKGFIGENKKKFDELMGREFSFATIGDPPQSTDTLKFFLTLMNQAGQNPPDNRTLSEALKITDIVFKRKTNPISFFHSGKVGILFGNSDMRSDILAAFQDEKVMRRSDLREDAVKTIIVPQIKKSAHVTLGESWGFSVPKNSKKKDAAWAFLAFISEEENIENIAKKTEKRPAWKDLSEKDIFYESLLSAQNPPWGMGTIEFQKQFLEKQEMFISNEKSAEKVASELNYYLDISSIQYDPKSIYSQRTRENLKEKADLQRVVPFHKIFRCDEEGDPCRIEKHPEKENLLSKKFFLDDDGQDISVFIPDTCAELELLKASEELVKRETHVSLVFKKVPSQAMKAGRSEMTCANSFWRAYITLATPISNEEDIKVYVDNYRNPDDLNPNRVQLFP